MKKIIITSAVMAVAATLWFSCVKETSATPPDLSKYDPNLPVNITISRLVWPVSNGPSFPPTVLGDSIIQGVVIADDRSGNFYKQIIIEDSNGTDSTAGINIGINSYNLYNKYPIGRKVYIKLKGLTLANYSSSPEICWGVDATGKPIAIPESLMDSFIVPASYPHTILPRNIRFIDMSSGSAYKYINTLIHLDSVQFIPADTVWQYAIPADSKITGAALRYVEYCQSGATEGHTKIIGPVELFNSTYADFYNAKIPSGYGDMVAVFSTYSSNIQLQIRDTTDMNLIQSRCQ